MIVTLIGPVKFWWDHWDSPQHLRYKAWRQLVSDMLVADGHLVYRPHEAFKGQWTEQAQVVNDVAIRTSDVLLNLSPPNVYSFGSDDEIEYARRYNKTVLDLPCPDGTNLIDPREVSPLDIDGLAWFVGDLEDRVAAKRGNTDDVLDTLRQVLWILDGDTPQNSLSRETVIQKARDLTGVNTPEKITPDSEDEISARLQRAVSRLGENRDRAAGLEFTRLSGKIEGVKLALSYLEEEERISKP